jgi:hypothetical protein
MVAKYYIAIRPQTNEYHAIHKEGCPFLPDHEKRISLGVFRSDRDAEREGQKYFSRTKCCQFCLKEHQPERKKPVYSGIIIKEDIPANEEVFLPMNSTMFCFLN